MQVSLVDEQRSKKDCEYSLKFIHGQRWQVVGHAAASSECTKADLASLLYRKSSNGQVTLVESYKQASLYVSHQ